MSNIKLEPQKRIEMISDVTVDHTTPHEKGVDIWYGFCTNERIQETQLENIKQAIKRSLTSQPEQPNRIVITQYSNINIPEEKFPAIKAAIERVLNDDVGNDFYDDIKFAESKGWTCVKTHEYQLKLREAEEKAFNAARETEVGFTIPIHHHRFYTFQNYIIYKSKQDK